MVSTVGCGYILFKHTCGTVLTMAKITYVFFTIAVNTLKARLTDTCEIVNLIALTHSVIATRMINARIELDLAQLSAVCIAAHAAGLLHVAIQRTMTIAFSTFLRRLTVFALKVLSALTCKRIDAVHTGGIVLTGRILTVVDVCT